MIGAVEPVEKLRADFMRRWFAIAISVGFATTVVNMSWVQKGKAPDYVEFEQLARLLSALVATVLSWEGYLISIQKKPLKDLVRYFIDIFLVFLYLFMLLTSKFPHFWIYLHALTFILYMIWDFLTIALYRDKFVENAESQPSVIDVYFGGAIGEATIDRGPIITIVWGIYFIALCVMPASNVPYSTFFLAIFIMIGLGAYRIDKTHWRKRPWAGPIAVLLLIGTELGILSLAQRLC